MHGWCYAFNYPVETCILYSNRVTDHLFLSSFVLKRRRKKKKSIKSLFWMSEKPRWLDRYLPTGLFVYQHRHPPCCEAECRRRHVQLCIFFKQWQASKPLAGLDRTCLLQSGRTNLKLKGSVCTLNSVPEGQSHNALSQDLSSADRADRPCVG